MSAGLIRTCPTCGAKNRIPPDHLGDEATCGKCKQPLPPIDEPVEADPATFDAVLEKAKIPVLVDFWASWCGPCKMAEPEVKALAREMARRALVLKVDTERYPELASRYRVQGIPNFLVIRNGKVVTQRAGVTPRSEMRKWLETAAVVS